MSSVVLFMRIRLSMPSFSDLELLLAIEKLGGLTTYKKALSSPEDGKSLILDALASNNEGVWITVRAVGPSVYMYIDTSEGHSGSGQGWMFGLTRHYFQGILTRFLPWDMVSSKEIDFTFSAIASGQPGVNIDFSVEGHDVATIASSGAGLGGLVGFNGKFTWGAFNALTTQIQRSFEVMSGLEKAGGAAAYEAFLKSPEPAAVAPRLPMKAARPNYVAASGYFSQVGSYIHMSVDTLNGLSCRGYSWGSINLGNVIDFDDGMLTVYGGWSVLKAGTFYISPSPDSTGGINVSFSNNGKIVALLACQGTNIRRLVGLRGTHTWTGARAAAADAAA